MPYGVGVIGAGPGAGALHLPTLARLPEDFLVVHVSDGGSGRAAELAARNGARASAQTADLLADPRVEVVAVCSPPELHAAQILAAVAAGKRAVLCEKPLATTTADAEAVVEACRSAGVALLIGTNHLYDAAWGRAKHHLLVSGGPVRSIAVTVALPPNARYHDVVTETLTPVASRGGPPLQDPEVAASVVGRLIVGLAVHDLPLLRDLAADFEGVDFATAVAPLGFAVAYRASGIPVLLNTVMLSDGADALWRIDIATDSERIEVRFPPAFVHAGSATVRVHASDGRITEYPRDPDDGYLSQWRAFADVLNGRTPVEYDELLADAVFAVELADAAAAAVRRGADS